MKISELQIGLRVRDLVRVRFSIFKPVKFHAVKKPDFRKHVHRVEPRRNGPARACNFYWLK